MGASVSTSNSQLAFSTPGSREGINLQFAVMGGGHGADAHVLCRWDRIAMARAAPSVGSVPAPELIEKHQRIVINLLQKMRQYWSYEKRRYSGSAQCSARRRYLRRHVVKDGQFRTVAGRNVESCLSHQGKKSDGFQRYRLTAGIGTGDDQQIECVSQRNGDRDHLLRIQQGMTAFPDVNASVLSLKTGRLAFMESSQASFGENEVQFGQDVVVRCGSPQYNLQCQYLRRASTPGSLPAPCRYNSFKSLFSFTTAMGSINRVEPVAGLIVNHAGHLAAVFGLDRDTVAVTTHGDDGVLQISAERSH